MIEHTKRLREWMAGKPLGLATTAMIAAAQADSVFEMMRMARAGNLHTEVASHSDVDSWLRLYRRRRRLEDLGARAMGVESRTGLSGSGMMGELRHFTRMQPEERLELLHSMTDEEKREVFGDVADMANAVVKASLELVADETGEPKPVEEEPDGWADKLETHFFLLVWFPCWIEYREPASRLLRKARCGDIEALDKLLRIDKSIIADKRIQQIFHQAAHDPNQGVFRRLVAAWSNRPDGQLTRGRVKRRIAGLISMMFKACGQQIDEPEVRRLYDILAQMGGGRIDTDIPDSPETFAKALQRARKDWEHIMPSVGQK